jgi:molecular chaperone HtpG
MTITRNEFNRRMREMNQNGGGGMYAFMGNMPERFDVVVNSNHPSITKLAAENDETKRNETARQLADLALLAQNLLTGEALNSFIQRSVAHVN